MLTDDLLKLKELLRKHRPSRKYQNQFADILVNTLAPNPEVKTRFEAQFPKLAHLKQMIPADYSYCSLVTSMGNTTLNTELEQSNQELNNEDERLYRKKVKNAAYMPILEEEEEIKRIIECFKTINSRLEQKQLYEKLHQEYEKLGGKKDSEQLKEKIESDVMYLVKRQIHKKKR